MRMLCYKCDHVWNYKGKNIGGEGYITCPKCYYKIRVDKALIDEPPEQKLLTNLPRKRILPIKLLSKLPTTTSFERVYFPDGFDCLVHKDIAAQFREITLKDLEDKETVSVLKQEEKPEKEIKIYVDQFGDRVTITPIKQDQIIKIIPIDPIKILEHQRSFF